MFTNEISTLIREADAAWAQLTDRQRIQLYFDITVGTLTLLKEAVREDQSAIEVGHLAYLYAGAVKKASEVGK